MYTTLRLHDAAAESAMLCLTNTQPVGPQTQASLATEYNVQSPHLPGVVLAWERTFHQTRLTRALHRFIGSSHA